MTEEPIDHIVERVRAGEVDAYAEIIRRYQHVVWRIASFALQEVGATEDLVQQVFVNAYEGLGGYQSGRDFGAWLRTIARNQVRRHLRQRSRDERKLRRYHAYLAARFDGDEVQAKEAERREQSLRQALQRCREQLSAPATEALALRYEQAKGFDAIALALGRTVAATRQLLARTRLALRQCIEKRTAHAHE